QPAQRGPAFLHGGQPGRVGVQRLGVGRDVRGYIGQQEGGLGQPARNPVQDRVVRAPRVQRPPGQAEQGQRVRGVDGGGGRVTGQCLMRCGGRRVQRVGVGQPLV